MRGRILRGVGGFYYVYDGERIHECRARGRFRRDKVTPMVGDLVEFSPEGELTHGYVEELLPRSSQLKRPPVSNIDRIFAVVSISAPEPDLLLLDHLLVGAHRQGIDAVVCINKLDLSQPDLVEEVAAQYVKAGYPVLRLSAAEGVGIDTMRKELNGHISALAGQSGVGKSSLINQLLPGAELEVGEVSRIERGRHTTRHCELILLPEGGLLADTPGFSLLEGEEEDPLLLKDHFIEFAQYEDECRFATCQHIKEPDCAVRQAAERGEIAPQRMERYARLHEQARERWEHRYD